MIAGRRGGRVSMIGGAFVVGVARDD